MLRKQCVHNGVTLPELAKGLLCDRGYLFIRLFKKERPILRQGCGAHTKEHQKLATIVLNRYREQMHLGTLDIAPELKSITMSQAFDIFIKYAQPSRNRRGVIERVLRPAFGKFLFDELSPAEIIRWREKREKDIDKRTGKVIKFSTVNRDQEVLQSTFSSIIEWVKQEKPGIDKFKTPSENPCRSVGMPSEKVFSRDRVPNRDEMKRAKQWCLTNDPELWDTIIQTSVTMLRKKDFASVQKTGLKEGTQSKTGQRFKVRALFPRPVSLTNWRKRWETLQRAMGWNVEGTATHTVWHDLRHWGPTVLAEHGYGSKLIQKLTGHATEEMVNRYTNLREEKLLEATEVLKKEMESL